MPGRRIAWAWLAAALVLFAGDLAAHLPITDFCDYLARRFGFEEYDRATRDVFLAAGLATAAALWWAPANRRAVRAGVGVLAASVGLAKALLLVSAIENVHYPQYALIGLLLIRAGLGVENAWLAAVGLGAVDEAYQHAVLPRGTPAYLDANDIVLNAIGALLGVVLVLAWFGPADRGRVLSIRAAVLLLAPAALVAAATGPLVSRPFWSTTPGGRHFHLLSAFEAVIALGLIWAVVRRLALAEPLARRIGAVPSAQVVADSA